MTNRVSQPCHVFCGLQPTRSRPRSSPSPCFHDSLCRTWRRCASRQIDLASMSSPLAMRAARKSVGVGNSTGSTPITPRPRFVHSITPENSPSLSASTPFNWNATRGGKAPLYSTPLRVKQLRNGENPRPASPRRIIRKKSLKERFVFISSSFFLRNLIV